MKLIDGVEWNPISFTEQLIPPILRDEKLETRRIVRGLNHEGDDFEPETIQKMLERFKCPYGKAGGRLWVRERFVALKYNGKECLIKDAEYAAFRDETIISRDGRYTAVPQIMSNDVKWRPPMHCPFWASRISLEVVSIGIERLQQITEAGAIAEGFQSVPLLEWHLKRGGIGHRPEKEFAGKRVTARDQFIDKWDQINGNRIDKASGKPMTWEFNPFAWVVKFKRIKP